MARSVNFSISCTFVDMDLACSQWRPSSTYATQAYTRTVERSPGVVKGTDCGMLKEAERGRYAAGKRIFGGRKREQEIKVHTCVCRSLPHRPHYPSSRTEAEQR